MFGLTCACCGADITAPQFYRGKAYGYTCIKKIDPTAKQVKDNGLWIKADSVEFIDDIYVTITVQGLKFKMIYGVNGLGDRCVVGGSAFLGEVPMVKLAMFKNGNKPLYKSSKVDQLISQIKGN